MEYSMYIGLGQKISQGNMPLGKKIPLDIPEDFITTKNISSSKTDVLSNYISISDKPFSVDISTDEETQSLYFNINGLLFDSFLNVVRTKIYTSKGDNFKGIFGLGERVNKDFFFKDGVYSMYSRD